MRSEGHRIEFKEILTDKIEKEVVAFLNSKEGGILFIGINDDGKIIGISESDKVGLQITNKIKNNISPPTLGLFDVIQEEIEGNNVI